jgi:hypothetical protein
VRDLRAYLAARVVNLGCRTNCNLATRIGLACYQNTPLGAVKYKNGSNLFVTIRFVLVINYLHCKRRTLSPMPLYVAMINDGLIMPGTE